MAIGQVYEPSERETFQRQWCRALPRRGRGKGNLGGEGNLCSGDVTQEDGREFLDQRTPKGSSSLGSFLVPKICLIFD